MLISLYLNICIFLGGFSADKIRRRIRLAELFSADFRGTKIRLSAAVSGLNTVIGTLAVDGWAVTFGTAKRGFGGLRPLLAVPNVTAYHQRLVYQLHAVRSGAIITCEAVPIKGLTVA